MSPPLMNSLLSRRAVLVIGPGLAALAQQALPAARLVTALPEASQALAALRPGLDLVLVDADVASPAVVQAIVEQLVARPAQPALLLVGAHLPTGLVRALFK